MEAVLESRTFYLILTGFVGFLIGLSKGGLGGTLGATAVPILTLAMTTAQANGLALPMQMLADVFAVGAHWKKWERKYVLLLMPGAFLGVVAGTAIILASASQPQVLKRLLGVIVLLFVVYKLFETRILGAVTYNHRNWHGTGAGLVAGFASTLAQNGGPPVTIYLLMQQISPQVFIATSALFFFLLNWVKVPFYIYANILSAQRILEIAFLLPIVPAGVFIGKWLANRMNRELFEQIIIGLLALTAILLIAL